MIDVKPASLVAMTSLTEDAMSVKNETAVAVDIRLFLAESLDTEMGNRNIGQKRLKTLPHMVDICRDPPNCTSINEQHDGTAKGGGPVLVVSDTRKSQRQHRRRNLPPVYCISRDNCA